MSGMTGPVLTSQLQAHLNHSGTVSNERAHLGTTGGAPQVEISHVPSDSASLTRTVIQNILEIGTFVLRHSLIRSPACLLHTARFAHSLTRSLNGNRKTSMKRMRRFHTISTHPQKIHAPEDSPGPLGRRKVADWPVPQVGSSFITDFAHSSISVTK